MNDKSDIPEDNNGGPKSRSWIERLATIFSSEPKNQEHLMDVLRDAQDKNILSSEMLEMIERIMQVSEMQVREVMIPKTQMVVIKRSDSLEDILPVVIESGHSRFPVMDEENKEVVGMLLAKDLLKYYLDTSSNEFIIQDLIRPTSFTSQSKRLDILLREFRDTRNHIAIVVDEYDHVAGLVTIEDVLEQIVGEIEDEYDIDDDDDQIKKLDNDTHIVKASTEVDEFNEYFNCHFSDEEYDTIGGIVLNRFGHFPKRGERVKLENYRFKVLQSDSRRIYLLEVKSLRQ